MEFNFVKDRRSGANKELCIICGGQHSEGAAYTAKAENVAKVRWELEGLVNFEVHEFFAFVADPFIRQRSGGGTEFVGETGVVL